MTAARTLEGVPPELGLDRAQASFDKARELVSRGLSVRQRAFDALAAEPSFAPLIHALDVAGLACCEHCADASAAWEAGRSILPAMDALDAEHARFEAAIRAIEALLLQIAEPATARVQ